MNKDRTKLFSFCVVVIFAFILAMIWFADAQYVTKFTVDDIEEINTISHCRLEFTIHYQGYFPFYGQRGWRIYMVPAPYVIGWDDPQYTYCVWVMPHEGQYIDRVFWVPRPALLVGDWTLRVDAVNTYRETIASSFEFQWNFGNPVPEPVDDYEYRAEIPWVTASSVWLTSLALLNPKQESIDIMIEIWDENGYPVELFNGEYFINFALNSRENFPVFFHDLFYAFDFETETFFGNARITSDDYISYIYMIDNMVTAYSIAYGAESKEFIVD